MYKKCLKLWGVLVISFFVFFVSGTIQCRAASFMADMVENKKGETLISKFFWQDHQYRMDVKENGMHLTILVDRESKKTRVFDPSQKVYQEFENDDMKSLTKNPFEAHLQAVKNYNVKSLGKTTLYGIACEKQEIEMNGKVVMTAWISLKHNFPIKILNNLDGFMTELKGIRDVPLDPIFFKVPPGFVKQEAPEIKAVKPKKKPAITGKEKFKAPIGRRIGPGGELSVSVSPEKHITLILISESRDAADVFVNASNNGKPVTTAFLKNNISLKKMLDKKEFAFENKLNPDTIEVKVIKGLVRVIVNQESTPWAKEKSRETFIREFSVGSFVTDSKKKLVCDITADSQDYPQSKIKVSFFKGIHKDPIITETISLKNGQKKRYSFPPGNGIASGQIEVKKGDVQFILYPPSAVGEEESTPAKTDKKKSTPAETIKNVDMDENDNLDKKTEHGRMVLVLDASGSMWGQMEGKAKITIAKEVMAELIDAIPSTFHTGLTVYGHRRKGDCKDIEMLIPVSPHDASSMKAKIRAISPKGKTPLSESVRQAALALRYEEERATVVLISDGLETCDVDPCKLAAELAMTGVDFTIHVVGFGISKEEQAGLECLANNTGGLFLAANNAKELLSALSKTVEKVKEPPPPIIEEPGDASLKAQPSIPAGSIIKVHWEGPASRNDFIAIVKKNAPKRSYLNYAYTSKGNPLQITVPDKVGTYEIRYVFGRTKEILANIDLKVTPVTASLEAEESVPVGSDFKVVWKGPNNNGDYIAIVKENAGEKSYEDYKYTSVGNPAILQSPGFEGEYQLRYIMGQSRAVLAKRNISVTSVNGTVKVEAKVPAGSDIKVTWEGPDNKSDYITIVKKGAPEKSYKNYTYTSLGSPLKLKAPDQPGDYEVRYILNQSRTVLTKTNIEIIPVSAKLKAPASVKAGTEFRVEWDGPDYYGDYITIVSADAKDSAYLSYSYTSKGSPAILKAPDKPGKYEVRYILDQSRTALARVPITVE